MSLADGTRLGTYEITGQIGAGGMGEVYRATDTKLGREVAIKTLPTTLASDKERLARFEREAKLLASLNHAHIGAIYGLDEHDGTLYIAMELIEGQTLAERLKSGALSVADALRIALQIAQALETAHVKGVIHRDLKPANIMLTGDGVAKVLDFGLAKAFSNEPDSGAAENSPALSLAMTQQGIVLGTAGYMSPEQASAQATDQRADIWSFGVVVYEMLTGLPIFSGESVPHVLADVLKSDPDWSRLPKNLHPRIRLMLERCLEKKPRDRYHAIADARVDIERALNDPEGGETERAPASSSWTTLVPWSATAAALAVVVWALLSSGGAPEPRPVRRTEITLDDGVELAMADQLPLGVARDTIAWSPDGEYLAYAASQAGTTRIYLRRLNEFGARALPGTEGGFQPFFSPDGQWIGYLLPDRIMKIPVGSGAPQAVINAGNVYAAYWDQDDRIVYTEREGLELSSVGSDGRDKQTLLRGLFLGRPAPLPDGRGILLTEPVPGRVSVFLPDSKEIRPLIAGAASARYVPTGHVLYSANGSVMAVSFDLDALQPVGPAVPLLNDVRREMSHGLPQFAYSADGWLAYVPGPDLGISTPVWVSRDGIEEEVALAPDRYGTFKLSPDGRSLAVLINGPSDDVWLYDFERQTQLRKLSLTGRVASPIFSADGSNIAYELRNSFDDARRSGIYSQRIVGGEPAVLVEDSGVLGGPDFLASDGRLIYTSISEDGADMNLYFVEADDPSTPEPLAQSSSMEWGASVSPDELYVAYTSDESGQYQVYVKPFSASEEKWLISEGYGEEPVWSDTGEEIFYRRGNQWLRVPVRTEPDFEAGVPEVMFEGPYSNVPDHSYDASPDGQRFLVLKQPEQPPANRIRIVANWFEELRALVPTD